MANSQQGASRADLYHGELLLRLRMHRSLPHGVTREGLAETAKRGKRVS